MNIDKFFAFYSLTLLIIFSCSLYTHEPIEYTDREWDYLEKMLIIKPAQDAHDKVSQSRLFRLFRGLSITGLIAPWFIVDVKNYNGIMPIWHICFWPGFIYFIKCQNREYKKLIYESFFEIVEQWPKHKKYIPECFHPVLNDCFEFFRTHGSKDPEWQKKANAIIDVLHQAIKNHFVHKYYRLSLFIFLDYFRF
ncbi:MAG: hypothetical protein WDZ41_04065 [Candidatus Babeliales bacterium]